MKVKDLIAALQNLPQDAECMSYVDEFDTVVEAAPPKQAFIGFRKKRVGMFSSGWTVLDDVEDFRKVDDPKQIKPVVLI
jgi:hypothetical protein